MDTNRRNLLAGLGALVGLGSMQTLLKANSQEHSESVLVRAGSIAARDAKNWERREAQEIMRYAKAVDAKRRADDNVAAGSAYSAPHASLPLNMFQRPNKVFDEIPEPVIPGYMEALRNPQPGGPLERLLPLLVEFDDPWPRAWHVVPHVHEYAMYLEDKFSMPRGHVKPSRVLTPKYVYDLDDNFRPRAVADALGSGVRDMRLELVRKLEDMTEIMQRGAHGRELRFYLSLELPELYAKREAYMLEFFTWMRHVGYICYE